MTDNVFTPHTESQAEPTLHRNLELPKGVLQKNLKTFVYLGALLVLWRRSSVRPAEDTRATGQREGQPPQPALQDNTEQRAGLANQPGRTSKNSGRQWPPLRGDSALASATPRQRVQPAAMGRPAWPYLYSGPAALQRGNMQIQLTPVQQQAQLIAAKNASALTLRFASNLVYSAL
jgi:type IV secretion system protein VirB10